MEKSLKGKAISIKGRQYVLVADRVLYFNETYPNGSIQTELITDPHSKNIIVKAKVIPDVSKLERFYTGYSQAVVGQGYINETAALENAETSAVGRALALMGIGVIESIVSVDEINKAQSMVPKAPVKQWPTRSVPETKAKAFSPRKIENYEEGVKELNEVLNEPF